MTKKRMFGFKAELSDGNGTLTTRVSTVWADSPEEARIIAEQNVAYAEEELTLIRMSFEKEIFEDRRPAKRKRKSNKGPEGLRQLLKF